MTFFNTKGSNLSKDQIPQVLVHLGSPVFHHGNPELVHCEDCSFKTKNKESLKSHIKILHENQEVQECPNQGCTFKTRHKSSLRSHIKSVHVENSVLLNCESCNYKTYVKSLLRSHFKSMHVENGKLQSCEQCEFKTLGKRNLIKHNQRRHNN